MLRGVACLACVGGFSSCGSRLIESQPRAVVLISIDTLRADHLPLYGYQHVRTPNIDAFAAGSVVFENAYAHAPQTLPSHVSILSGRLPFEHGVRDNIGFTVKPDETLLQQMLHNAGYATGGFVSAYVLRDETGIGRGFDRYDATLPASSPEIAVGELQRDGAQTRATADTWLDSISGQRFFLFFHIYEPHSPYSPPQRFSALAPYDGEIAYADEILGGLVESLKRRGVYDDALVILTSDHGEGLGDHGEQEHGLFVYRETIRVPLIVKVPGKSDSRRVSTPVQHIDLLPTVADWARLPAPVGLRGRPLRPALSGRPVPEASIYSEALYPRYHFGWSELFALTDSKYAYIRAPRDELYDLAQDPGERRNIAGERQPTRSTMRAALDRLMAGTTIAEPGLVDARARERLRTLGYVGVAPASTGKANLPDPKEKVDVLEQYRSAIALVRAGNIDAALSRFQAIARDNPQMADVWSEIAGLQVRRGRLEDALSTYKQLVTVAPHDPAALVSVADLLLKLGRLDEAKAQASLASTLIPQDDVRWRAKAHETLAIIALERRDENEARDEARAAAQIDSTLPSTQYIDGLLRYRGNDFAGAVPPLKEALRISEGRPVQIPELRYFLGDALARLERYGEAEPILLEEVRLFPNDLRARAALAMLFRVTGRIDESNRAIEGIMKTAPTPEGRALVADLQRMFNKR